MKKNKGVMPSALAHVLKELRRFGYILGSNQIGKRQIKEVKTQKIKFTK
jgi:hypothetical protein